MNIKKFSKKKNKKNNNKKKSLIKNKKKRFLNKKKKINNKSKKKFNQKAGMLYPVNPSILTSDKIYSIIENKDNKIEICGHCENRNYIYTHNGNHNSCQIKQ